MSNEEHTMDGVQGFLSRLDLSEHLEMFVAKGFDSEDDLPYLVEEDLDAMYITDHRARQKILRAAPHYKPSKEYILFDWLRSKGLDHYFVSFIQSELVDLVDIARLNLPNEQLYDELEITLPGHKRRFERAVRSLAKRHKTSLPSFVKSSVDFRSADDDSDITPVTTLANELPVAYGRWGKPRCLLDAKYDFLILDATVVSTNDPRDRVHIEFMVDSGSDVVTLRQEVLDTMDLELIGPINSKGVHGSKVKNLYKANILIGNQVIEIEVMGESYDSIGSRVIRHFRHYISGTRHIWLQGDYIDPTLPHKTSIPEREAMPLTIHPVQETVDISQFKDPMQVVDVVVTEKRKQPETSGVPEEHIDDTSNVEELQTQIKSDFVKVDVKAANIVREETDTEITQKKIDFKFAKSDDEVVGASEEDDNGKSDETDRVRFEEEEIIDIRPIIAANRKRHASNTGGIDVTAGKTQVNGVMTKKKKVTLQNDKTVSEKVGHTKTVTCHVNKMETDKFRTVLSQRSVYYRSQVKEGDDDHPR